MTDEREDGGLYIRHRIVYQEQNVSELQILMAHHYHTPIQSIMGTGPPGLRKDKTQKRQAYHTSRREISSLEIFGRASVAKKYGSKQRRTGILSIGGHTLSGAVTTSGIGIVHGRQMRRTLQDRSNKPTRSHGPEPATVLRPGTALHWV